MSTRVAPRETSRSTSSRWSPSAGGARSKCTRPFPTFGIRGGPPQVTFGPPCGERIAVSWSWSQTSGHPSASLQKYPAACDPSHGQRPDEAAVGQEAVARLDHAELVALRVPEDDVLLLRALTDVDVPAAERECPGHRLLLLFRARCWSGRSASGSGWSWARPVGTNRSRNPVSSSGSSVTPSAGSSAASHPRRPDQKRPRRGRVDRVEAAASRAEASWLCHPRSAGHVARSANARCRRTAGQRV